jgi:hypothetical protein
MTVCGWCAGAVNDPEGVGHAHQLCAGERFNHACLCKDQWHAVSKDTAAEMAAYSHTSIEQVYAAHGMK